jgi:hypothetical protein
MTALTIIEKIQKYVEDHKSTFDLLVGGGIGAGTGVSHYWQHFVEPENLYKLYDGIFNTTIHTIIGAVLLFLLHKYVLKQKKDGKN